MAGFRADAETVFFIFPFGGAFAFFFPVPLPALFGDTKPPYLFVIQSLSGNLDRAGRGHSAASLRGILPAMGARFKSGGEI